MGNEPVLAPGLPDCPEHLAAPAAAKWQELAGRIGWLSKPDGDMLALYCVAWARWIDAEDMIKKTGAVLKSGDGGFYQNPYLHVANKAMEQMAKLGSLLGLNPVDRAKINVHPNNREVDEFAKFLGEAQ